MKPFLLTLTFAFICHVTVAQSHTPVSAAEIKLALKKLNTLGSVLYFAAHPDDENTRLISWLAKERLYRTGYLSLTRGDGGQNLIGTEQAEELGLIRTNELLAARRVDGGEQFFSRANDFGFSKTYDETFDFWNRDAILADAVWVIRKFRPDVIITRFPPDERAGHGHHQASAMLAIEAFTAAADPNRFPEQLEDVAVWQAKRILWNTSNFGRTAALPGGQLMIDIGDYNPLLGQSYGEIAAESRSNHKSQGFGAARQRGSIVEGFELLAGDLPKQTLLDGVETSWKRVMGSENIELLATKINENFNITHPEKSIDDLLTLLQLVEQLSDPHWKALKSDEIKNLILACGGIWFESYVPTPKYALGEQVPVNSSFIVRRPDIAVEVIDILPGGTTQPSGMEKIELTPNEPYQLSTTFDAANLTQPYWLEHRHGLGNFVIEKQEDVGQPNNQNAPSTTILLTINGKLIQFQRPIVYKYTDPVQGEVYESLTIAPRITANIDQRALAFNGNEPKAIPVIFRGHTRETVSANASLCLPPGWRAEPETISLNFSSNDEETTAQFTIYPTKETGTTQIDSVNIRLQYADTSEVAKAIRVINYDHIPKITWFPPAAARLGKIETGISAQRIGYLPGAGDLVPQALREIGLQVDLLSEQDVLSGRLSQYDAIVTGVRLYNVNTRMRHMQPHLLRYVENGGTLVVQYNTTGGLATQDIGPYPFTLSRNRVTDETAQVVLLQPESRILNFPNKITTADFEGWIQERGLYFVGDADTNYNQPLSMADSKEESHDGALIVASHGKGNFVYTSLSFFRQLPAGVPGAYRLFVNLLAKTN